MKTMSATKVITAVVLLGVFTPSLAAVSAAEAARLGTELTPMGGEKAGNAACQDRQPALLQSQ